MAWINRTLPSVTDHCGHDAGSQITRRIDGESYRRTVKEDQITVKTTLPVCIPNATVIPRRVKNTTKGTSQPGGGEFFLSVTANISSSRMNVPMNLIPLHQSSGRLLAGFGLTSSKKQFAEDM